MISRNKKDNGLFPVLLTLEKEYLLVVGGNEQAFEKLQAILTTSPHTQVTLVAEQVHENIRALARKFQTLEIHERPFALSDLDAAHLVIYTAQDKNLGLHIREAAHEKGLLVSLADAPGLSDFYLPEQARSEKFHERRWKKAATWILFAFLFMIIGHLALSYVPAGQWWQSVTAVTRQLDPSFKWMLLTGFCAQLIDGLLGMGYGLTCTTVLLSLGVNLPAISGSIHTAEMFSSGISGYSHYKFGNINKKLFYALLIPGILGAIGGAVLLSLYGDTYAGYIKPILAAYTLLLGLRILSKAFKKKREKKKTRHVSVLAGVGGFLDSFGGGGWGPLVTSTLLSGGRTPKYVIGSVSATEFFVTLASALTFFTLLGLGHWQVIVGLVIGGVLAAPLAARLSGRLSSKYMFMGVGALAVIWSLRILYKSVTG